MRTEMKTKFSILAAVGLLAMTVASCGKNQEVAAEKPPVVKGARVERVSMSPIEDYYEATGTVRSKTTTVLSSKIMGTVISLRAREGDKVSAGQALIEIDNRDANAQLQKAGAGLRQAHEGLAEVEARRAADTLKMLAAKKRQGLAQIDQAKADVANAQVFVSYARITSPITGVVVAKHTEVGSTATPGTPLLTIEDGSRYRLEVAVEESRLGKIRIGQRARLRIDALGADDMEGGVSEITPAADPMSRSYTVKIDLPARQLLRSGLYGVARFASGQRQAILIPRKSVTYRGQLAGVFVVDDAGVARLRLIQTGKTYGENVEALSGLNGGERVVVNGVADVKDGVRIQ